MKLWFRGLGYYCVIVAIGIPILEYVEAETVSTIVLIVGAMMIWMTNR